MGPLTDAGIFEIVGIGHGAALRLFRLVDHKGQTMRAGIGFGVLAAVKPQFELGQGLGRRGPAHQRINGALGFGHEFEQPAMRLGRAGLHGGAGWTGDACCHIERPSLILSALLSLMRGLTQGKA